MNRRERIIIVGHGNPEEGADSTGYVAEELHKMIHHSCSSTCVRTAYLQFMKPELPDAISEAVSDGADKIIIHPYLLSNGYHVTQNIPEMIQRAEKEHPHVTFIYTEPLGAHRKLVEVVRERIEAETDINKLSDK